VSNLSAVTDMLRSDNFFATLHIPETATPTLQILPMDGAAVNVFFQKRALAQTKHHQNNQLWADNKHTPSIFLLTTHK
jgi:hypothetical protein